MTTKRYDSQLVGGDLTVSGVIRVGAIPTTLTNAAGQVLSSALVPTGITAGTTGSATAIPILTVNAQGQVTAVSTAAPIVSLNSLTLSGTTTLSGHLASTGTTPTTIGVAAAKGVTGTTLAILSGSTDRRGSVDITIGGSVAGPTKIGTINFASTFASVPFVSLAAASSFPLNASSFGPTLPYTQNITTAGFDIYVDNAYGSTVRVTWIAEQ